jgi:hypothetical protein
MNDKQIYIAYVLDMGTWGKQLLRYAFEYPIVEYWAEPEEQIKLKAYFKEKHYSHYEPLIIEKAEILDFMPFKDTHATK